MAIKYAIRIQRDRRNITDAELATRILLLDEVNVRGGDHGNQYQKKVAKSSTELLTKNEDSATTTAKKAGTSASKVRKEELERVRRRRNRHSGV